MLNTTVKNILSQQWLNPYELRYKCDPADRVILPVRPGNSRHDFKIKMKDYMEMQPTQADYLTYHQKITLPVSVHG